MVDPKTAKRTRIGMMRGEQGKQRVAKRSGTALERGKRAVEKRRREKLPEEQKKGKTEDTVREPFWKRAFRTGAQATERSGESRDRQEEVDRSSVGSVRRSRESS